MEKKMVLTVKKTVLAFSGILLACVILSLWTGTTAYAKENIGEKVDNDVWYLLNPDNKDEGVVITVEQKKGKKITLKMLHFWDDYFEESSFIYKSGKIEKVKVDNNTGYKSQDTESDMYLIYYPDYADDSTQSSANAVVELLTLGKFPGYRKVSISWDGSEEILYELYHVIYSDILYGEPDYSTNSGISKTDGIKFEYDKETSSVSMYDVSEKEETIKDSFSIDDFQFNMNESSYMLSSGISFTSENTGEKIIMWYDTGSYMIIYGDEYYYYDVY
ncbi:MAG: hypothetical protein LIO99_01170 [Clostridiales bacterium]|nr:hypothetical protein [Clostridiales bacterium]